MNPRIRYVSARCVWIMDALGKDALKLVAAFNNEDLCFEPDFPQRITSILDRAGRDAVIEALCCERDTGSFAALSDESNVPFQNKRMRAECFDGNIADVTVTHRTGDLWHYICDSCSAGSTYNGLLPLSPAPKVAPYDNCVEPARKLASLPALERYINYEGRRCWVSMVGVEYVFLDNCHYNKIHYKALADATWSDGTPFGVQLP